MEHWSKWVKTIWDEKIQGLITSSKSLKRCIKCHTDQFLCIIKCLFSSFWTASPCQKDLRRFNKLLWSFCRNPFCNIIAYICNIIALTFSNVWCCLGHTLMSILGYYGLFSKVRITKEFVLWNSHKWKIF